MLVYEVYGFMNAKGLYTSGSINSLYIQTGKKKCAHLVCMVNRNLILPDLQVSLIQPSRVSRILRSGA